jgi:hypothetical protein
MSDHIKQWLSTADRQRQRVERVLIDLRAIQTGAQIADLRRIEQDAERLAKQLARAAAQQRKAVGARLNDRQVGLCEGEDRAVRLDGAGDMDRLTITVGQINMEWEILRHGYLFPASEDATGARQHDDRHL